MFKIITVLVISFLGSSALACIARPNRISVCPGDMVYKGSEYSQGAVVVAVNSSAKTTTVRSIANGSLYSEWGADLYVTNGCLSSRRSRRLCVGNIIYKGGEYSKGGRVVGIHPETNMAIVLSISNNTLYVENGADLEAPGRCRGRICVGDLVFKDDEYSQGGIVESLNPNADLATVRSNSSNSSYSEPLSSLYTTFGCSRQICVGQRVYKGEEYSQGADVVAVHDRLENVVVRSVANQRLYVEAAAALDTPARNDRVRPPRP